MLPTDTGFKFDEMLTFRDEMALSVGAELLVKRNEAGIAAGTNPIAFDTKRCCGLLKTHALLGAQKRYGFDAALGGARRDEEKSRAKERLCSFRDRSLLGWPLRSTQERTSVRCYVTATTEWQCPLPGHGAKKTDLRRWLERDCNALLYLVLLCHLG
jgi:hypothetical protein